MLVGRLDRLLVALAIPDFQNPEAVGGPAKRFVDELRLLSAYRLVPRQDFIANLQVFYILRDVSDARDGLGRRGNGGSECRGAGIRLARRPETRPRPDEKKPSQPCPADG